jgi:hypothetical protein
MTVGDPRAMKDKRRLTMLFAWTLDEAGARRRPESISRASSRSPAPNSRRL